MKPIEYYENKELNGSYQYVPLSKIIDDFTFETTDDDSILKNTRRTRIIKKAKDALLELNKSTLAESKVMEITVPENLAITMPHDYVGFVRMSLVVLDNVTGSYRLHPLNGNQNINIAVGVLQNHEGELLFNQDGQILNVNGLNAYNEPYKRYQFAKGGDNKQIAKFGEYTIDKNRGQILFSSDLALKEVVLQYKSDGLQYDKYGEDEIKVHKDMIAVFKAQLYFFLIEYRQHITDREKNRALLRLKTEIHQANLKNLNFSITRLMQSGRNANA